MDIKQEKKAARQVFLAKRRQLSPDVSERASEEIRKNILRLATDMDADAVLLFHPIKNEPDLLGLVKALTEKGVRVGFPISRVETVTLDFRLVKDIEDMVVGAYGICEPSMDAEKLCFTARSLCVVPALAYDKQGFRLGYGKGYYDRFLASFPGKSVGAVFSELICDSLTTDEYDVPVDIIITEEGVIRPNEVNKTNIHPQEKR